MNKISSFQAASLAFCFSLARMVAFRPNGENMLICIIGELCACAVMAALALAAYRLPTLGKGLPAKLISSVGVIYYLYAASLVLAVFADSMQYSFPDFYTSPAIIAALAAAAAYCSSMGVSACGRTACAAVLISLTVFTFMAAGASSGVDTSGIHLAVTDKNSRVFSHFVWALGNSFELPLLLTLKGHIDRPHRAAVMYTVARAVMWAVVLALCGCVLGDHAEQGLPVFSLAAYSKTAIIERFDALILLMWSLSALLSLSMIFLGTGECVRRIMQKRLSHKEVWFVPAAVTASAACIISACAVSEPPPMILAAMLLLMLIPASLAGGKAT